MKKSKFTEAQIVFALQQAESGVTVAEVCRKLGISEATFYSWKKKYGGLGPVELRRLRQLEEENAQLKRIVADLTLDKQMLQDVLKKSFEDPPTPTVGNSVAGGVSGLGATRVCDGIFTPLGLSLSGPAARRSGGAATDERDCGDAGALRLRAHSRPAAARRLARQSQAHLPHLQGRRAEFKEQATAAHQDRGPSSAATAADWTTSVLEHGFRQ